MKQNVDDVGFIRTLIDRLIATEQIDEKRIYVTGMSNGAMLTTVWGLNWVIESQPLLPSSAHYLVTKYQQPCRCLS